MKQVFVHHKGIDITEYIVPSSFKVNQTYTSANFKFDVLSEFVKVLKHDKCEIKNSFNVSLFSGHVSSVKVKSMLIHRMTQEEFDELIEESEDDEDSEFTEAGGDIVFVYEVLVE